jgi:hypothetical protein
MGVAARAAVAILLVLSMFGAALGFAAYHTPTMNWDRTEVIDGWENVRYVVLIVYPLCLVTAALVIAATMALAAWVGGGGRS